MENPVHVRSLITDSGAKLSVVNSGDGGFTVVDAEGKELSRRLDTLKEAQVEMMTVAKKTDVVALGTRIKDATDQISQWMTDEGSDEELETYDRSLRDIKRSLEEALRVIKASGLALRA